MDLTLICKEIVFNPTLALMAAFRYVILFFVYWVVGQKFSKGSID